MSDGVMTLTAGQKAALTRKQNKEKGITGNGKPDNGSVVSSRSAGLILEQWVTFHPDRIECHFRALGPDQKPMDHGLGEGERSLPLLTWTGYPDHSTEGEMGGFRTATLSPGLRYNAVHLDMILPLMKRVDKVVSLAIDESEDSSFPFVLMTVGNFFRSTVTRIRHLDGTVTDHKRGATYVTMLRLIDRYMSDRKTETPATKSPDKVQSKSPNKA